MLMGFGLLGLLGSDNIRCLFMPAWLVWLMPRMGFGLADEQACHDAGSRETSCRWAGCCGDAGGERELAWALTAYPGSGICKDYRC
jgi:hypothetical protein